MHLALNDSSEDMTRLCLLVHSFAMLLVPCLIITFLFSYKSLNCAAMVKESSQTKHFISANVEIAKTIKTHEAHKTRNVQQIFSWVKTISTNNNFKRE